MIIYSAAVELAYRTRKYGKTKHNKINVLWFEFETSKLNKNTYAKSVQYRIFLYKTRICLVIQCRKMMLYSLFFETSTSCLCDWWRLFIFRKSSHNIRIKAFWLFFGIRDSFSSESDIFVAFVAFNITV